MYFTYQIEIRVWIRAKFESSSKLPKLSESKIVHHVKLEKCTKLYDGANSEFGKNGDFQIIP
jgi:hypothetical protein